MSIYTRYFDELVNLVPSINDSLNLPKYKHLKNKMENTYSKDFIKKDKELCKKYLKLLADKKEKNIYDESLIYMLKNNLRSYKFDLDLIPLDHQENPIYYIFEMATGEGVYLFETKKDYKSFIEKMEIFPEMITSIIELFRKGIKKGFVLSKIMCKKLIEQHDEFIDTKSYQNKKIKFKLDFDFNKACGEIFIPPLKNLNEFLRKEYLPKCVTKIGMCNLPNGKANYQYLIDSTLTLSGLSPETIHQYGLKEVKRIDKEMIDIKNKLGFKGDLASFNKFLLKRKDLTFKSRAETLRLYKKELKKIDETVMKTNFYKNVKGKCEILGIPKSNEDFSAEAYYMGGDISGKRNGRFYINLKNINDNNKIEIESLTLHEANPGHHYQITYVNESSSIPLFIKNYMNDAYQEGWALYCENLGEYKTLESYYGKLVLEMLRAVRLVVDTGIHYYGWSYTKTFNYMKKHSFDTESRIKTQLDRYIAIPSQALSYKIGEKIILNLKKKFKGDIKEFHHEILRYGPIPLFILVKHFVR